MPSKKPSISPTLSPTTSNTTDSYASWMRRWRRLLGIPFVICALYLSHFSGRFVIVGSMVIALGEFLRLWAAGHLRKEQVLTTGGPYRFTRNPLYLGSFLIAIGFCLVTASPWILLLVLVYFLFCYLPVVHYEEQVLKEKFASFGEYAQKVGRYLPRGRLWPEPSTQFSWQQVWKNKEYNAVLGIIAVFLFLLLFRRQ